MTNRAKLQLDKVTYIFEYDPQTFTISYAQDLAANQVLDAVDPDIRSKSASTSYKLSRCMLLSRGLNQPQSAKLKQLQTLALSRAPMRFTYGTESATVYIESMSVDIKQWKDGKPAHCEIDLTLKTARAPVRTKTVTKVFEGATAKATPNMVEQYKTTIENLLKAPANQSKYKVTSRATVEVGTDKSVTLRNGAKSTTYTLADFGLK